MATTQIKNGFQGGTDDQLLVNPDGSINVNSTGTTVVIGTVDTNIHDSSGNPLNSTAGSLDVNVTNTVPVSGTVTANQGTNPWTVDGTVAATQSGAWTTGRTWTLNSATDSVTAACTISGTVAVTQSTSPWVVSGTVTANAGTGTFLVDGSAHTQPISGTITANQGTSPWVVSGSTTVSGTVTANQGTSPWVDNISQFGGNNVVTGTGASGVGIPRVTVSNDSNVLATQSGAWTTGRTWTLSSSTDSVNVGNFPATVAVTQSTSPWVISGTVTANIGTTNGLALDSTLSAPQGSVTGGTAGTKSELAGGVFNTVAPTLTNGQQAALQFDVNGNLKTTATATVAGTVTVNQGTTPWVDNISQFGGSNVVTGTGASGAGIPRVTVSNDSNILATQSGTWNITNISGTISLPTGASTSALQTTGNTSLASIDTKTPPLGQAVMASSSPVVIASNQTAIPVVVADQTKVTYSASANFTVAATATDIFTITGSASKTIKIRYVDFNGINTGNTNLLLTFLKRSTANSGGTSSTVTAVPHNSTDAAASATVRSYTVNPTTGTLVGAVGSDYLFLPALASTNAAIHSNFTVADDETKPITLIGVNEVFAVNLNGALITGTTTVAVDITWTEE